MPPSPSASQPPVLRFAPSPNGRLHLGHALSALTNERLARMMGGRLLLRIEDIDRERCTPALEAALRNDLAWLGIAFDGAVRQQSEHFADYRVATRDLRRRGLVYACFCSRQEVRAAAAARAAASGEPWPTDPDGAPLYPGTCRASALGEGAREIEAPHVLRLDLERALTEAGEGLRYGVFDDEGAVEIVAAQPRRWGDVVLARKDAPTSYHLAVVLDDARQGVTHVVRGRDLEAATDIHVLLQRLLGLPAPLYRFHDLLVDAEGRKLSKSRGSESLAELRAKGVTAQQIRRDLGFA
ncbi:MAG: tRNA glutamyl-Q(34) synthetase GluQRS [Bosea sp. (in: a-proteobacteria)]|uniref:tRNA glutamyl-Q(34) synthetase GluQRS n=1 Tax=Bosea sp. (in: a-proteobacteria) TaxID=1871050 RepID=UPI002733C628|nr:tRNA glutamyl-Q(34) synthetase GluQRS [Bosea sp. (in: a-proteobacteria)]MDP3254999.1 tRNA glutamyl-Q(34) synthetase GluQRS [Bosea sp. (in: a-proteobacteria)]MDP3320663.1 tRNA glutamyl-Q(34) synthetase GluQRS [Bosea sp. (in: a-proteobacteria)]